MQLPQMNHPHEVLMMHDVQCSGFVDKSQSHVAMLGNVLVEDLDRHSVLGGLVDSFVDGPHSTRAEPSHDLKVRYGCSDERSILPMIAGSHKPQILEGRSRLLQASFFSPSRRRYDPSQAGCQILG